MADKRKNESGGEIPTEARREPANPRKPDKYNYSIAVAESDP
jgi:hypothetical protein